MFDQKFLFFFLFWRFPFCFSVLLLVFGNFFLLIFGAGYHVLYGLSPLVRDYNFGSVLPLRLDMVGLDWSFLTGISGGGFLACGLMTHSMAYIWLGLNVSLDVNSFRVFLMTFGLLMTLWYCWMYVGPAADFNTSPSLLSFSPDPKGLFCRCVGPLIKSNAAVAVYWAGLMASGWGVCFQLCKAHLGLMMTDWIGPYVAWHKHIGNLLYSVDSSLKAHLSVIYFCCLGCDYQMWISNPCWPIHYYSVGMKAAGGPIWLLLISSKIRDLGLYCLPLEGLLMVGFLCSMVSCLFCMFRARTFVLKGKDIIPTIMCNISSCSMFSFLWGSPKPVLVIRG